MEEALDLSSDRILNERMNDVLCRSAWPFKQLNCGSMTRNARARVCVCVYVCVCRHQRTFISRYPFPFQHRIQTVHLDFFKLYGEEGSLFKTGRGNGQGKVKTFPVQAWTSPEGSRRLRLPGFVTIGT